MTVFVYLPRCMLRVVISLEKGTKASCRRILMSEPIRPKGLSTGRSSAEPHYDQSTIFYDLMSLGDGLYLTRGPEKTKVAPPEELLDIRAGPSSPFCGVLRLGLSSPGHILAVAP